MGPYAVVRRKAVLQGTSHFHLFGFTKEAVSAGHEVWTTRFGVYAVNSTAAVSGTSNTGQLAYNVGSLDTMNASPAAITVKILCAEPYNTATGVVYIGQCRQRVNLEDAGSTTYADLGNNLLSFTNSRTVSAPQLLHTPMETSGVPLDMNQMSMFDPLWQGASSLTTMNSGVSWEFAAFSPIFVYNPSGGKLTYEITQEWRVRFREDSPFQSTMTMQPPASETAWYTAIAETVKAGVHTADELVKGTTSLLTSGKSVYDGIKAITSTVGPLLLA